MTTLISRNVSINRIPAPSNGLRPVHPGEILREEYLIPLGLSANALSQALNQDNLLTPMASSGVDPSAMLNYQKVS